jgi:hypothetical protein
MLEPTDRVEPWVSLERKELSPDGATDQVRSGAARSSALTGLALSCSD